MKNKRNWSSPGYDQITNYWIKKLSTHFKGIATALAEIINKEKPLLNTMYKAITSVTDNKLKDHQEQYKYMQIDHCSTGSMGCIDSLAIDKGILEDAEIRRKNLSYVWIDVKKAFDSVNHKWLKLCLQMHCIPDKIAKFITVESNNEKLDDQSGDQDPGYKRDHRPHKIKSRNTLGGIVLCKTFHHLS